MGRASSRVAPLASSGTPRSGFRTSSGLAGRGLWLQKEEEEEEEEEEEDLERERARQTDRERDLIRNQYLIVLELQTHPANTCIHTPGFLLPIVSPPPPVLAFPS